MKTLITLLLLLSLATLAQTRIIPFSTNPPAGGGGEPPASYVTDSLKLYFNDSTYVGTPANWTSIVNTYFIHSGAMPAKTDSGLVYDGTDYINQYPEYTGILDSMLSIEIVMQLADTTAEQNFVGVMNAAGTQMFIGVDGVGTGIFVAEAHKDGAKRDTVNIYSALVYEKMKHIVITYDGSLNTSGNALKLYLNGVLQVDIGNNYATSYMGSNRVAIGGDGGGSSPPAAGTVIRLVRFYNSVLTLTQVNTNLNSSSVQDKGIE